VRMPLRWHLLMAWSGRDDRRESRNKGNNNSIKPPTSCCCCFFIPSLHSFICSIKKRNFMNVIYSSPVPKNKK
jgi:hypothetical protein